MDSIVAELADLGADEQLISLSIGLIAHLNIPHAGIKFGVSNGASCVIIPKLGNVVYQIYRNRDVLTRVFDFCSTVHITCLSSPVPHPGCKFLVPPASPGAYLEFNCIVFKKITALNQIFPEMIGGGDYSRFKAFIAENESKILEQIGNAIDLISKVGWAHGDVVLDNIGVLDDNFVLFDYDQSKQISNMDGDLKSLQSSINFWKTRR